MGFNGPLARVLQNAFPVNDTPNPWDDEIDEAVRGTETTAVCTKCLEPGAHDTWMCRNCGWPAGEYVNMMPYLYIFSIGAFFRSGVDGSVRLTFTKMLGLGFIALCEYGIFAPLYWIRLVHARFTRAKNPQPLNPE